MTYEFRTQPWEHQRRALRQAWRQPGFGFFMEPGTGKSKVACDEMSIMYEEGMIDTAVVIPPKSVMRNWVERELPAHVPERILQDALVVEWGAAGGRAQDRQLERMTRNHPGLRILVMNVEALGASARAGGYLAEVLGSGRAAVYVDEATKIKNHSAARTKSLAKLRRRMTHARVMTGTPITAGPMDLYSQMSFAVPGLLGTSFMAYRARYAVLRDIYVGARRVPTIVGYRNLDELRERVAPHIFRVTKEECLDLPPRIYKTRDVELTDEQWRAYREVRDDAATMVGSGAVTTQMVITQLQRLQQIALGYVVTDDGDVVDLPTRRPAALDDELDDAAGRAIVWVPYRHVLGRVVEGLRRSWGEASVAEFHGGNAATRDREVERWRGDPDCRWLVATQGAGAYGNTWNEATHTVFYANDFDLEHRLQAEDRNYRGGQNSSVVSTDLVARGTMDERHIAALREKMDIAQAVTGDAARGWLI